MEALYILIATVITVVIFIALNSSETPKKEVIIPVSEEPEIEKIVELLVRTDFSPPKEANKSLKYAELKKSYKYLGLDGLGRDRGLWYVVDRFDGFRTEYVKNDPTHRTEVFFKLKD